MAKQLLGKEVTAALNAKLQAQVEELKAKGVVPTLGIVRVGERPDDLSYERGATKRAELIGVEVEKFVLPEDVSKEDLLKVIDEINANDKIHGVLMFRPLPKHLKADQDEICNRLDPKKDVDGMTDLSNAGVFMGKSMGYAPCTPAACMEILDHYSRKWKNRKLAAPLARAMERAVKKYPRIRQLQEILPELDSMDSAAVWESFSRKRRHPSAGWSQGSGRRRGFGQGRAKA